jgi:ADP-heptose:LPS heptosyltransferase
MHLIETYALTCGAKINKPYIYEKYIPLPLNEYIVLQPHSKPSKTYDLWQEVIDILFPILNKVGISIVQIGGQNENAYRGVVNLSGKVDVNQSAYIIRNAKLFLGVDSFGAHLASHFDIPIVSLYSNNNIPNVRPYFGSKEKQVLLEPERNTLKPTYSLEENPKSINRINS